MHVIIIERTFDHYNSASCLYTNYNINNEQTTHNFAVFINIYCIEDKFLFYIISYERDVAIYMKPYHAYISVQYY